MDRYEVETVYADELFIGMKKEDGGEWVKYSDAMKLEVEIAELNAQIKAEEDSWSTDIPEWTVTNADAIRKAAEVVAAKLQKENFPTAQALAMGRMYAELLAYADKLKEKDDDK